MSLAPIDRRLCFAIAVRTPTVGDHYINMSVVPTVRRLSPTVGVHTAAGKYSRRLIGARYKFL
jgi:hypothetical protein